VLQNLIEAFLVPFREWVLGEDAAALLFPTHASTPQVLCFSANPRKLT
jgi:hypothetical protein